MSDPNGTWKVVMQTPLGAQQMTVHLQTDGASLSGRAETPFGPQEFTDGRVDGDTLSWTVQASAPVPMTIEFNATVDGDSVSGTANLGAFGVSNFSGTRA
jgi:hypothetical protein